jgi:hypothetical protein
MQLFLSLNLAFLSRSLLCTSMGVAYNDDNDDDGWRGWIESK